MSPHHPDQMSQVSKVTLWGCSLNIIYSVFPNIWKFSINQTILRKSENFPKIWKFKKNCKFFHKSKTFPRVNFFPNSLKICQTFWKFFKNLKTSGYLNFFLSKNQNFFQKSEILLVRSCLIVTLITCLHGHMSLGVLYDSVLILVWNNFLLV